MKLYDCCCLGRTCVDYLILTEQYPLENQKKEFLKYKIEIGGQAAISSITLSRLGLKTKLVSVIGKDQQGKFVTSILKQEKVDIKDIIITNKISTPVAFVWVNKLSGSRTILYQKLPKKIFFPLKLIKQIVEQTKIFLIDHQEIFTALKIKKFFKEFNTKVVFDAEEIEPELFDFLPYINYLVCSEDFIKKFSQNRNKTIKNLLSKGPEIVCVTLGEKGVVAITKEHKIIYEKGTKVPVIDTTGAGDVFRAAFVFGVYHNLPIKQTLHFANKVAALSCKGLGGREKIPYIYQLKI